MGPVDDAIVRHYTAIQEEDRITHGFSQLELLRVQEILRRHLPDPPASVLDVGGATGIHARWLAEAGYQVRIIDIKPRHVAKANDDLGVLDVVAEVGNARQLPGADDTFDVVLLFGPLYHLIKRRDRLAALREATRVVRSGGLVAAAGISRYASLLDGLARGFLFDPEFRSIVKEDLASCVHRNSEQRPHWWTTAFFHRPEQLREELVEASLRVAELVGVEGLPVHLPGLTSRWEDPVDRDTILWAARSVEAEPSLLGLSPHLLAIARAP